MLSKGASGRRFSPKFVAFSLTPALLVVIAAECATRVNYFFDHAYDWTYLTAPLGRPLHPLPSAQPPSDARGASAGTPAGFTDQMVFAWRPACVNQTVYSTALRRDMPRTWDENCFRGDRVTREKDGDEFRIVFLGGSTVEDAQSDAEMMTEQFKRFLPARGRRVTVVNAGRSTWGSAQILAYWESAVRLFQPDLVLYYEAWNEQHGDVKFTGFHVGERLARLRRLAVHRALYYRSMLYTYAVERFGLHMIPGERFWKIDVRQLHNVVTLARRVRAAGGRFVFVTQVVDFPRWWKEIDTFDSRAVEALLDRLRADPDYRYDVREISALNQRLAVFLTIDACVREGIPVLNILNAIESLRETRRAKLFTDLGHLTVEGDRVVGHLIAQHLDRSGSANR